MALIHPRSLRGGVRCGTTWQAADASHLPGSTLISAPFCFLSQSVKGAASKLGSFQVAQFFNFLQSPDEQLLGRLSAWIAVPSSYKS